MDRTDYQILNILQADCRTTLKNIGDTKSGSVFKGCTGMEYVRTAGGDADAVFELPETLQTIGRQSFYRCTGFPDNTSVTIPSSVTYVGSEAFHYADPITDIFVETDDAGSYDGAAFKGNSGSGYGLGKRLIIFKDSASKKTFKPSGLSSYKNAVTYEFLLYYGEEGGTAVKVEPKLYGQAVNVCKSNGEWYADADYTMPEAESGSAPTGYGVGWAYNGKLLTVNTVLKPDGDELYLDVQHVLLNPTIEFIVDGEVISTEGTHPKINLSNDKEHQIGDALVPVAVAEAFKVSAQVFQCQSLLTAQAPELKNEWDEAVPMPPLEGSFPSQAAHPKASP